MKQIRLLKNGLPLWDIRVSGDGTIWGEMIGRDHKCGHSQGIPGAEHPDNWLSLDLLRRTFLGEQIDLSGRQVIVLGGGNVALDAARTALRLGVSDVALDAARTAMRLGRPRVRIICRGMRAAFNEIEDAVVEGIEILRNRVIKEVVSEGGKIVGVRCREARVGEIIDGRRQVQEIPGTDHVIPGDMVVWAVGQQSDFSFLPREACKRAPIGLVVDEELMTTMPGIFIAGDARHGNTAFVVDAIGEGHKVARREATREPNR